MRRIALEICVDEPEGLAVCADADVDRVELCAALDLGGLTPSHGFMKQAAASSLPVWPLIRPRPGDFHYSSTEVRQMCEDIAHVRWCGLAGVVIGAAAADGALDIPVLQQLMAAAGDLPVALHRVVDTLRDPVAGVGQAAELGMVRVLTSGGAARAVDGTAMLSKMTHRFDGAIEIMAGSGVGPENATRLVCDTNVRALHASCRAPNAHDDPFGFGSRRRTDAAQIRALNQAISTI